MLLSMCSDPRFQPHARKTARMSILVFCSVLFASASSFAQQQERGAAWLMTSLPILELEPLENQTDRQWIPASEPQSSFVKGVVKDVLFDPTTYAPAILSYTSGRLDWDTSQVFFNNGFIEANPQFTLSGLPADRPMDFESGKRIVLNNALVTLQMSVANNVTTSVIERWLVEKYPHRRKLLRTLSWIERIAMASYVTHLKSDAHFRQWKTNERLMDQYGLK